MSKRRVTLAIETAVGGGSLSLFVESSLIDRWVGEDDVSRSEELLTAIGEILKRNRLETKDLTRLAVSLGPGSYTGARIGLSTAIGLKNGLSLECFGASVFDALFHSLGNTKNDTVAALPFGKNEICFRFYKKELERNNDGASAPKILAFEKFVQSISNRKDCQLITDEKIYLKLSEHIREDLIINAGTCLSDYIGRIVLDECGSDNLKLIYILSTENKNLI